MCASFSAKLLATRELALGADGATVSTDLTFDLPDAGPRVLRFAVAPLPGEANARNAPTTPPIVGPVRGTLFERDLATFLL